jgi:hypothetical protein
MLAAMKRYLTPITVAAAAGVLAVGAAGGAVAASAASSTPQQPRTVAQMRANCAARADLRGKLREAFKAERQKENVQRLDPAKRQEIAKPILDQAVADGKLPAKAEQRILNRLGRANRQGQP